MRSTEDKKTEYMSLTQISKVELIGLLMMKYNELNQVSGVEVKVQNILEEKLYKLAISKRSNFTIEELQQNMEQILAEVLDKKDLAEIFPEDSTEIDLRSHFEVNISAKQAAGLDAVQQLVQASYQEQDIKAKNIRKNMSRIIAEFFPQLAQDRLDEKAMHAFKQYTGATIRQMRYPGQTQDYQRVVLEEVTDTPTLLRDLFIDRMADEQYAEYMRLAINYSFNSEDITKKHPFQDLDAKVQQEVTDLLGSFFQMMIDNRRNEEFRAWQQDRANKPLGQKYFYLANTSLDRFIDAMQENQNAYTKGKKNIILSTLFSSELFTKDDLRIMYQLLRGGNIKDFGHNPEVYLRALILSNLVQKGDFKDAAEYVQERYFKEIDQDVGKFMEGVESLVTILATKQDNKQIAELTGQAVKEYFQCQVYDCATGKLMGFLSKNMNYYAQKLRVVRDIINTSEGLEQTKLYAQYLKNNSYEIVKEAGNNFLGTTLATQKHESPNKELENFLAVIFYKTQNRTIEQDKQLVEEFREKLVAEQRLAEQQEQQFKLQEYLGQNLILPKGIIYDQEQHRFKGKYADLLSFAKKVNKLTQSNDGKQQIEYVIADKPANKKIQTSLYFELINYELPLEMLNIANKGVLATEQAAGFNNAEKQQEEQIVTVKEPEAEPTAQKSEKKPKKKKAKAKTSAFSSKNEVKEEAEEQAALVTESRKDSLEDIESRIKQFDEDLALAAIITPRESEKGEWSEYLQELKDVQKSMKEDFKERKQEGKLSDLDELKLSLAIERQERKLADIQGKKIWTDHIGPVSSMNQEISIVR